MRRLGERFRLKDVEKAYQIGFIILMSFLAKHRIGNPSGYTEYFTRHSNGSYCLRDEFLREPYIFINVKYIFRC